MSVSRGLPNKPVNKLPDVAESIFCTAVISTGSLEEAFEAPGAALLGILSPWCWPALCALCVSVSCVWCACTLCASEGIPISLCPSLEATGSSHALAVRWQAEPSVVAKRANTPQAQSRPHARVWIRERSSPVLFLMLRKSAGLTVARRGKRKEKKRKEKSQRSGVWRASMMVVINQW